MSQNRGRKRDRIRSAVAGLPKPNGEAPDASLAAMSTEASPESVADQAISAMTEETYLKERDKLIEIEANALEAALAEFLKLLRGGLHEIPADRRPLKPSRAATIFA